MRNVFDVSQEFLKKDHGPFSFTGLFGGGGAPFGRFSCFIFSCPDWKRKKAMQYLRVFVKGPGGIVKDVEREPWNNNL